MKCPKCGYLGFEHVERCRNCGYDFSLTEPAHLPELTLRDAATRDDHLAADLELIDAAAPGARMAALPEARSVNDPTPSELPLFGEPVYDDEPLITKASPPRQPLSVRRATPEAPRLPSQSRMPMLDFPADSESGPWLAARADAVRRAADRPSPVELEPAGIASRALAMAIDLLILAVIDLVVIYFTLQICGLALDDFGIVPKGPLVAFLLVQNGGYLIAFTVGGQTLGKMAAGIKVIPARAEPPIDLGRSVMRTLVWFALAVPAGLGFLTAFIGHERRGLHDRIAGTRVVRTSA
jgi:uncharacterized RDD family membrane protein YckC